MVIISTVRSINEDKLRRNTDVLERLSFLYQPKRFNVVITRAKALMIVVGNPHVLEKNKHWKSLLEYAIELNAYKGCNLPIHLDKFLREQAHQTNENLKKALEEDGGSDSEYE